jgi:hypothetical protein
MFIIPSTHGSFLVFFAGIVVDRAMAIVSGENLTATTLSTSSSRLMSSLPIFSSTEPLTVVQYGSTDRDDDIVLLWRRLRGQGMGDLEARVELAIPPTGIGFFKNFNYIFFKYLSHFGREWHLLVSRRIPLACTCSHYTIAVHRQRIIFHHILMCVLLEHAHTGNAGH